jgi:hypothetical protein
MLNAASTGTTVWDTADVNIGTGGKITINGTADSLVIINVSGNFKAGNGTAGAGIILIGGITSDQILWHITSSSGNYQYNNICGIFLDTAGSCNLNEGHGQWTAVRGGFRRRYPLRA